MAKKYNFKHNNMEMSVTLEDEDDTDFTVEINPVEEVSGGGNFTLIKPVANLLVNKRSGKAENALERVTFKKPMTVEISYTEDVIKALEAKGKKQEDLELGYFLEDTKGSGTGTWYAFSDKNGVPKAQTRINPNNKTGTVTFRDWFIDPGVGWGTK